MRIIPIRYYNKIKNIGDQLNPFLAQKLFKSIAVNTPFMSKYGHYLMIGSVLGAMTKRSRVYGSGFIDGNAIDNVEQIGTIKILRGELSRRQLENKFGRIECLLGDPALILPRVILPSVKVIKTHSIGIIPHYVDYNEQLIKLAKKRDWKIISVGLPVEQFIHELQSVNAIFSSSLHGLILADSYGIPNGMLRLSDRVVGGDYKFCDYYSTTVEPKKYEDKIEFDALKNLSEQYLLQKCNVAKYIFDQNELFEELKSIR